MGDPGLSKLLPCNLAPRGLRKGACGPVCLSAHLPTFKQIALVLPPWHKVQKLQQPYAPAPGSRGQEDCRSPELSSLCAARPRARCQDGGKQPSVSPEYCPQVHRLRGEMSRCSQRHMMVAARGSRRSRGSAKEAMSRILPERGSI